MPTVTAASVIVTIILSLVSCKILFGEMIRNKSFNYAENVNLNIIIFLVEVMKKVSPAETRKAWPMFKKMPSH